MDTVLFFLHSDPLGSYQGTNRWRPEDTESQLGQRSFTPNAFGAMMDVGD